jgi:predicted naringenin-chalcone synthase
MRGPVVTSSASPSTPSAAITPGAATPGAGRPVAHIARPAVMPSPHVVSTGQVLAQIHADHPDHPKPQLIDRLGTRIGVETRHFVAPVAEVAAPGDFTARNTAAYAHVRQMGTQAARKVLADHGVAPGDIDGVVTSHSTGLSIPGLDVHLIEDLGLSPRIARVPMTQLGCAGGAQALVQATRLVAAGCRRVLVVVSETLTTVYQKADDGINALIYKLLFSDGAGACLVTSEPVGPGPVVEDTFEFVLPDSTAAYYLRIGADGYHFDSTKAAIDAVGEVMPEVAAWSPAPEFGVIHPGGPAILDNVVKGLDVADDFVRHARASLAEMGNGGGVSIFDVLRRTFDDAPPADARGLVAAFGPGFVTAALRVRWGA